MNEGHTAVELIERAFRLARESGKPDWWAMTIPVLKNRLLLLTKNTFKEADFGATSFRDFLSRNSEVVSVEETPPPGFVILKSASRERSERLPANKFRGDRLRADLWTAVLDYSSGRRYVWDLSEQAAKPANSEEEGLVLPTISAADLQQWRDGFVESLKPTDSAIAERVEEWRRNSLPTVGLPAPMRPIWNNYLKRKVERRLQDWFVAKSIKAPAFIERRYESAVSDREAETLREFIVACVKVMPKGELLELRISPSTAMRTLRIRGSGTGENER
jgi:hypothetical protein